MGNCLVTRLKDSVDAFLPKLGDLKITMNLLEGGALDIFKINDLTVRTKNNILSLSSGGPFTNEVELPGNNTTNPVYFDSNGIETFYISNSYNNLKRIYGWGFTGDFDLRNCNNLIILQLNNNSHPNIYPENVYIPTQLKQLQIRCNNIYLEEKVYNINSFEVFSSRNLDYLTTEYCSNYLPQIQIINTAGSYETGLYGDMAELGKCVNLSFINGGNYSGSIEGFVSQARLSRSTQIGSIDLQWASNNATFNGSPITHDGTRRTLSWTSNTITYDGVTINA